MTRRRRILRNTLLVTLVVLVGVFVFLWLALRASLPQLEGDFALAGLRADASIARDSVGAVTIDAKDRIDAYRALGFVHGQERCFEMDLMRRVAAGELAELFGAVALPADRRVRVHRFRRRAADVLARANPEHRAVLDAYVEGVNAGVAALGARPFPYLVLRQQVARWRAEDSILVAYAMFLDLHGGSDARELALGRLREGLPPTLYAALAAPGTSWDAPLFGAPFGDAAPPAADEVDLRKMPRELFGKPVEVASGDLGVGSNNFAVAGALSTTGSAIVANDMHLGLRVPDIWFRARLRFAAADGTPVDVTGVTLPGVPAIVAGSNGHVAWGFTNSYGDWMDFVHVRWSDAARTAYNARDGSGFVRHEREELRVAGGEPETLDVLETEWGPVVAELDARTGLALAWTAHDPRAVNLELGALETARDVDEAIAIAHRSGVPPQNFVVGDRGGRIAWTLIGAIPIRSGDYDARVPSSWPLAGGWTGWLAPAQVPRVVDPPTQRIWTANARVVDGQALAQVGDGGYALGARSRQIRDALFARERFAPADLLAIQLDDRALFLERWWQLLRATLERSDDPALAELARVTGKWEGRASTDAVAYRLVRAFRLFVHESVLDGLAAPMRVKDPDFRMPGLGQVEGVVWRIVQERPAHLLPPPHADWDALLLAAARRVDSELGAQPGGLAARTWGEKNTTRIQHPLSRALPMLSWLLDMPARALPGDIAMPRVQGPGFGASERFVVSPGHEDESYFHMPGGQSGHPLSPYYGAGHEDWEQGKPTPFLPGKAEHTLTLQPL